MGKLFSTEHSKESKTFIIKSRKDSSWIKYFNQGKARATATIEAPKIEHMIDLSQLFLGSKFAKGAHSQLYHGTYKGEPVAVKIIHAPEHDGEKGGNLAARLEKQFNQEVTLLSHLHHPNVIKLVGVYKQPSAHCVVTEYLSEGSLRAYLNSLEHDKTPLPLQKMLSIALDIARGMVYVHSQGVLHRDLKPENILIDQGFQMKIADFGVSSQEGDCRDSDEQGTYRWMAPEMIKRRFYNRKVDVYSFGLMLFEMVSGEIPYADMNPVQAAYAVAHKNLRPVLPKECPAVMRDLIERCWSSKPKDRPEFWQVVKVLEQFQSSLACDGSLKQVQSQSFAYQRQKKGFLHSILYHGCQVHP